MWQVFNAATPEEQRDSEWQWQHGIEKQDWDRFAWLSLCNGTERFEEMFGPTLQRAATVYMRQRRLSDVGRVRLVRFVKERLAGKWAWY